MKPLVYNGLNDVERYTLQCISTDRFSLLLLCGLNI